METNKLSQSISKIKLLISDVDGVLTDGKIQISSNNVESKFFNVEDGTGAALAYYAKLPIALISGRYSKCTEIRAKELNVTHCIQDTLNKKKVLDKLLKIYNVKKEQVAYIGDSLVDIPVLTVVGLPIAVSNAHPIVKNMAIYITDKLGGQGVLLEVVEKILIGQNKYKSTLNLMKKDKFE